MKVPLTYERKAEQQHPRNRLEQKKAERFKVVAYKTTYKMMFSYQQVEEMIVNIHWLRLLSKQDKLFYFLNKDNISNKNYTYNIYVYIYMYICISQG